MAHLRGLHRALPRGGEGLTPEARDALERLGFGPDLEAKLPPLGEGERVGRIVAGHRGEWLLQPADGELRAKVPGRLRRAIEAGEAEPPAVGDFVVYRPADPLAVLVAVVPRRGAIVRKAAGRETEAQVLAANVDVAFVVQALGDDVNARRLERFLALAAEGGARPVVVLTKADLFEDPEAVAAPARALAGAASIHLVSNETGEGQEALRAELGLHQTAVLLGASGAGKSSLLNRWLGQERQATAGLTREGKGRHTTTHRELVALPDGGLVIDTPGIREVGLLENEEGIRDAFPDVEALAPGCRFADCRHENEPGCAVIAAAKEGSLPPERLEAFGKLRREAAAMERLRDERARAEGKRRAKVLSRAQREYQRMKKK